MATVNKTTFSQRIQGLSSQLADVIESSTDIVAVYFDRGYNSGGSDPIIDGDVSDLGILAADIAAYVTLAQQLQNFADNAAVTSGDYSATLNKLRTDV